MRVLELITGLGGGGAERQLRWLTGGLRSAGIAVEAACLTRAAGVVGRQLTDEGVPVHDLRGRRRLDARPLIRLDRLLRRGRFDVVHSHLARPDLLAGALARRHGVAHVVTRHDDGGPWRRAPLWSLYRRALAGADAVVAVSPEVAAVGWGVAVRVIDGAVERARLAGLPPPVSPARRVGFLGRLAPVRGVRRFLAAAARLSAARPELTFHVAGDGPLRRRVERAAGRGLPLTWHGWVDDPGTFLADVDLVVVPPEREGLGMAASEALAAGRPVVATPVGALRRVVGGHPLGTLAADLSPRALADAVLRRLGQPAVAAPVEALDVAGLGAAYARVFERVLAGHR